MQTRRILSLLKGLFFIIIIGTPLFYFKWSIYPYIIPKAVFLQIAIEILFFLWLALAIVDPRYRPKMTPLSYGVIAYVFVLTVAALVGIDPLRSFFSSYERVFGVFLWYHLAALVIVAQALSHELPWKRLWYASFITSMVTVLGALIQLGDPNFFLMDDLAGGGRPGSTFGNPGFLAGYLLLNVFFAIYYLLPTREGGSTSRAPRETAFLIAAIVIDVSGIFITQTRGDILGLFAGIFTLFILFIWRPPAASSAFFTKRSVYATMLAILLIFSAFVWFTRTSSVWQGVPGFDRLKDVSLSYEGRLAPRLMAYRAAWQGFSEKPFLGWGPENFNVVFSKHYDPRALEFGYAETAFDKPHSVPLEQLVSGGVALLLAYLALFVLLIREAWRSKDTPFFAVIVAVTVAYFIRSAFVFDTLGTALMFSLILAFTASRAHAAPEASPLPDKTRGTPLHPAPFFVLAVPAVVMIYIFNLSTVFASYHLFWGHVELQLRGNTKVAMLHFRGAVDPWSPYQWGFVRDYANTLAQAHFYDHGIVPIEDLSYAIARMERVAATHKEDAYNHYLLADIYNLVSDIDPQKYLPMAEAKAREALVLSPGRQEILFYLAKTKNLQGDNAAALQIAKQALDEAPKVADSHFYYGMLAFAMGQNDVGYKEVRLAIDMGRKWHNFYEPRVAGDYFADAGHLEEAIELYKTALMIQPGDLEAEIKLGAAYFINGEHDLARPYLKDAAARFDFKTSPQYDQYKPILDALGIR